MDKALLDAQIIGLPITLQNFKDGIMETAHKQNKTNSLLFSGGRNGPISKEQYQKQVIRQQFANEVLELTCRETTPLNSSSTKAERKRQAANEEKNGAKKMAPTVIIINHGKHYTLKSLIIYVFFLF